MSKWKKCEHSWSDTSIYDEDGRQVCTKSIRDEATETTQDELDKQVQKDFDLISAAPDLLEALKLALPHIECNNAEQSSIIDMCGTAIDNAEGGR
jgi:hypothetical protein